MDTTRLMTRGDTRNTGESGARMCASEADRVSDGGTAGVCAEGGRGARLSCERRGSEADSKTHT
jgi:hypothetical protein